MVWHKSHRRWYHVSRERDSESEHRFFTVRARLTISEMLYKEYLRPAWTASDLCVTWSLD